jgi:hypothetical protein
MNLFKASKQIVPEFENGFQCNFHQIQKKNPLENAKKPNKKHTININIHFKIGLEYTKMTFTSLSQVTTSQVMTRTHTQVVPVSLFHAKKNCDPNVFR